MPLIPSQERLPYGVADAPFFDQLAYSIEETARITSLGRTALYDEIKTGRLKARKAGRRTIFNPDGGLKRLDELDDDVAASIASIEVNELRDVDGFVIGHAKKFRLWDKLGALSKLAQHLGLLDTKITLKGDSANPLTLLIQSIQNNSMPIRQVTHGDDDSNT